MYNASLAPKNGRENNRTEKKTGSEENGFVELANRLKILYFYWNTHLLQRSSLLDWNHFLYFLIFF